MLLNPSSSRQRDSVALSKVTDDTKLSGAVDTHEEWDGIQRDMETLKKWVHEDLMNFIKTKCKVLHLGRGNPQYQHRLGNEGIERSPVEKDLGMLMHERLNMTQQ
ncbi:rna-directed dna polymerase from mobile element jockey-like [Pitangus sulphuratus]|nr:rna-directed dna polymerase from mobile element jockey-like [Pitangus sulphuratus]